jgi:hypothetical protein
LFFVVSMLCFASVLVYTSTGINIQFGLCDRLNVIPILNFTLRFAIFQAFGSPSYCFRPACFPSCCSVISGLVGCLSHLYISSCLLV